MKHISLRSCAAVVACAIVLFIASQAGAQIRQTKLYLDDAGGNFLQLVVASLGAGHGYTLTFPSTAGVAQTGVVTPTGGTPATGDVLYYDAATGTFTRLAMGATGTVLHGQGAGAAPMYSTVNLATDVGVSVLSAANGGTGTDNSTSVAANTIFAGPTSGGPGAASFRAIVAADFPNSVYANPMATLGDMIYENSTPAPAQLAGNTTTTTKYLTSTGNGTLAAAPAWAAITSLSDLTGNIHSGLAGSGNTGYGLDIASGAGNGSAQNGGDFEADGGLASDATGIGGRVILNNAGNLTLNGAFTDNGEGIFDPTTDVPSLWVKQTSHASPASDIFDVTDATGASKYFAVDNGGNIDMTSYNSNGLAFTNIVPNAGTTYGTINLTLRNTNGQNGLILTQENDPAVLGGSGPNALVADIGYVVSNVAQADNNTMNFRIESRFANEL